jgi:hypothetical protein
LNPTTLAVLNNTAIINKAFKEAEKILEWEDNWDGEGSPKYERETLDYARNWLITFSVNNKLPEDLNVWAGPDGSIDISWHIDGDPITYAQRKLDLLINVEPTANKHVISWYGDTPFSEVKGESTDNDYWLFQWLEDNA